MPAQKFSIKPTESSGLLNFGQQSYSYVQIPAKSSSSAPDVHCRECNQRGSNCYCEERVGTSLETEISQNQNQKHKFAQRSLLIMTVILSLIIVGSALFLKYYSGRPMADKNPFMMSVFLDDESTSRFEVVDNTVDVIRGRRTKRVLASGTYVKNADGGGWNHLTVRAGEGFSSSPSNKAYSQETSVNYIRSMEAAGYLEGFATCTEIGQYYVNFYFGLFDGGDPTEGSLTFLEDNYDWMSSEAEKNWETSDYWLAVKGLLAQLNGLLDGVKNGCPSFSHPPKSRVDDQQHHNGVYLPSLMRNPSMIHLLLLNANGDLYQISDKFSQKDSTPTSDDNDDEVDHPFSPPKKERKLSSFSIRDNIGDPTELLNQINGDINPKKTARRNILPNRNVHEQNILQSITGDILDVDNVKIDNSRRIWYKNRRSRGGEVEGSGSRSEGVDHCSALIKFIPDKGGDKSKNDLIIGHNTWDDFQCAGPRIFKHYSLPLITGFTVPDTFSTGYNAGSSVPNIDKTKPGYTGGNKADPVGPVSGRVNMNSVTEELDLINSKRNSGGVIDINRGTNDDAQDDISSSNNDDDNRNQDPNSPGDDDDSQSKRNNDRLEMHFSSSPGLLSSIDDFFTLSGRGEFVVLETTMDVYNSELLQYIQPDTILSWTRTRLANQLASTGAEWAEVFSMYHSGTYANQWMVVDLTRFRPGKDPLNGLLTVLEEIPGYMHSADVTSHLTATGYWASYNNPYFEDISVLSGNADICSQNQLTCYDSDPRALLFKKHHNSVYDLTDMQRILGLNEYQRDPIALNDSCNAIACRQDLEPILESRYPFGALDGKVTSARLLITAKAYEENMNEKTRSKSKGNSNEKATQTSTSSSASFRDSRMKSEDGKSFDTAIDYYATSTTGHKDEKVKPKQGINGDKNKNGDEHRNGNSKQIFRAPHAYARMGPSNSFDGMPPFCWDEFSKNRDKRGKVFSHLGQPNCFDFDWKAMPPPLSLSDD